MKSLTIVFIALFAAQTQVETARYDFRASPQYASLAPADQKKVEAVHHDLILLTGALERYADDHGEAAPKTLGELVPIYVRELPQDPFATMTSAAKKDIEPYTSSLKGLGYRYRQGHKRSWIIGSVGLPEFPYLAERGNVGLYLAKGLWISGKQLIPVTD